jgi:uncharacterized protein (DUF2267 family)
MKRFTDETFLSELQTRLGVSRDEAAAIARAVVVALGKVLSPIAARHVANVLPPSLAPHLKGGLDRGMKRKTFVDHVARVARTRVGSAWEDTIVVCDLLRDALDADIGIVTSSLPRDLRLLFDERPDAHELPRSPPPPRRSDAVPSGQTLSSGRPGPMNPIVDAAVDVRGPAQHDSVAAQDPHAARKISSAQPGSAETLSSGRPR